MTALSAVRPDYEQIRQQLIVELAKIEESQDFITASTGAIILDLIAAIGAYDQLAIERATHEVMLSTARLPSSIYSIMRMLGVRIQRRIPAQVHARAERSDAAESLIIPKHTAFDLEGTPLFNREDIIFLAGEDSKMIVLYEGSITTQTFISDGQPYQRYELGAIPFAVSDSDVFCRVGREDYARTTSPLWEFQAQPVFYDSTTQNGYAGVMFGNDVYGMIPEINALITFTFAETDGAAAHQPADGKAISVAHDVSITATSALFLGEGAKNSAFYQHVGGALYAGRQQGITRGDHVALALTFPGVVDAKFRGQADIAPREHAWMNMVQALLLTSTPWGESEWLIFREFMEQRSWFSSYFIRRDPDPVVRQVIIDVHALPQENLTTLHAELEIAVREFFRLGIGSIGRSLYLSDLHSLLINHGGSERSRIDYVVIREPQYDLLVNELEYNAMETLTLNMRYSERA